MDSINIISKISILLETSYHRANRRKNDFCCKKEKVATYRTHKILTRQSSFKSLGNEILFSKEHVPQSVKENVKHEKTYDEIA